MGQKVEKKSNHQISQLLSGLLRGSTIFSTESLSKFKKKAEKSTIMRSNVKESFCVSEFAEICSFIVSKSAVKQLKTVNISVEDPVFADLKTKMKGTTLFNPVLELNIGRESRLESFYDWVDECLKGCLLVQERDESYFNFQPSVDGVSFLTKKSQGDLLSTIDKRKSAAPSKKMTVVSGFDKRLTKGDLTMKSEEIKDEDLNLVIEEVSPSKKTKTFFDLSKLERARSTSKPVKKLNKAIMKATVERLARSEKKEPKKAVPKPKKKKGKLVSPSKYLSQTVAEPVKERERVRKVNIDVRELENRSQNQGKKSILGTRKFGQNLVLNMRNSNKKTSFKAAMRGTIFKNDGIFNKDLLTDISGILTRKFEQEH